VGWLDFQDRFSAFPFCRAIGESGLGFYGLLLIITRNTNDFPQLVNMFFKQNFIEKIWLSASMFSNGYFQFSRMTNHENFTFHVKKSKK
jgi:hypothetical protein